MIKKAVVLAAGLGKRMRAEDENVRLDPEQSRFASMGLKTLIPIMGQRTLLEFIFENLSNAGFTEFCLVIGNNQPVMRDFCRKLPYPIDFAIQEKPIGTADAVLAAEDFANGENFLVVNSDNLYPVKDLRSLRRLESAGFIAFDKRHLIREGNIGIEKINQFAILKIDANDRLTKITEKPQTVPEDALISMNAWVFSPKIFDAARNISPSTRNEFELTDAVNFAIRNLNEEFRAVYSDSGVLDLSSRSDVEKLKERLDANG